MRNSNRRRDHLLIAIAATSALLAAGCSQNLATTDSGTRPDGTTGNDGQGTDVRGNDTVTNTDVQTTDVQMPTDVPVVDIGPGCTGAGMMMCGANCVNTQTDDLNCGSCGAMCIAPSTCMSGSCRTGCAPPMMVCGASCVDTMTDNANCGSCGNACTAPAACVSGTCSTGCTAPLMMCGAGCVDTTVDAANCGSCGNVCPVPANATASCAASACGFTCNAGFMRSGAACVMIPTGPANDARASALPVTFAAGEATITGTTVGSTYDGPATAPCGCTTGNGNVWYRFTLAATEVVYFDTFSTTFDTSLFITDAAGTPVPAQAGNGSANPGLCNDDAGCAPGDRWSRIWGNLAAGTYYLAVGGCATGAFSLHSQHIPNNIGSYFYTGRISGTGSQTTNLVGTSASVPSCTVGPSGEDVRWFTTCGATQFFSMCRSDCNGAVCGTFVRTSGGRNYDPAMYIRSSQTGTQVACNDDGGSMGGTTCTGTGGDTAAYASRLNAVMVPRGLAASFVDERTQTTPAVPGLSYTVIWRLNP